MVDHIDENKLNNNIDNLKLTTYSKNIKNYHIINLNYQNKKKADYKIE